jgi:sulfate adenylyltransferase subunit 1 (EFTu-like GTPase family)
MVNGGPVAADDEVLVLPEGSEQKFSAVKTCDAPLEVAPIGLSVSVTLAEGLHLPRGTRSRRATTRLRRKLEATVRWFGERPLRVGVRLRAKRTSRATSARASRSATTWTCTGRTSGRPEELADLDVGVAVLAAASSLAVDPYRRDRVTASFVLVDEAANPTVTNGMVSPPQLVDVAGPDCDT